MEYYITLDKHVFD